MQVDVDEHLEKLCSKCRDKMTLDNSCHRCGETIFDDAVLIENKNFDISKFEEMAGE